MTCGALVIALALPISLGMSQSRDFSENWPNATSFVAILGPLVDHGNGHLLVEDPSIPEYYLHAESQWTRWSSTGTSCFPAVSVLEAPAVLPALSALAMRAPSQ